MGTIDTRLVEPHGMRFWRWTALITRIQRFTHNELHSFRFTLCEQPDSEFVEFVTKPKWRMVINKNVEYPVILHPVDISLSSDGSVRSQDDTTSYVYDVNIDIPDELLRALEDGRTTVDVIRVIYKTQCASFQEI